MRTSQPLQGSGPRVLMSTRARDCFPPRVWVIWVLGRVAKLGKTEFRPRFCRWLQSGGLQRFSFCRLCSKNEHNMLLEVLKFLEIMLFSLNYMLLAFKLCCLVLSEIKAERHLWFLILDPRQLATESYEWGLKPRNMRTTKQTNKHRLFHSLQ